MADPSYTPDPADVELVAEALYRNRHDYPTVKTPWCEIVSGEPHIAAEYRGRARAALSALAATGRLTPADATVRSEREYEVELIYPDGTVSYRRVGTERSLADALAASPKDWEPLGTPGTVYYRDVTTVLGPWLPAPIDGGSDA